MKEQLLFIRENSKKHEMRELTHQAEEPKQKWT